MEALLWIGAGLALVAWGAFTWASVIAGRRADALHLEALGCSCPGGLDGYHCARCPLSRDDTDEAGA